MLLFLYSFLTHFILIFKNIDHCTFSYTSLKDNANAPVSSRHAIDQQFTIYATITIAINNGNFSNVLTILVFVCASYEWRVTWWFMWIFTREIVTTSRSSRRGKAANIRLESHRPARNGQRPGEDVAVHRDKNSWPAWKCALPARKRARSSSPDQLRVLFAIVEFIGAVSECNLLRTFRRA